MNGYNSQLLVVVVVVVLAIMRDAKESEGRTEEAAKAAKEQEESGAQGVRRNIRTTADMDAFPYSESARDERKSGDDAHT